MSQTITEGRDHAWFALVDAKGARLLRCRLTRQGTHHVDDYDALENTLPQQEHARPMTNAGTTHAIEEEERRFAGEIMGWLQQKAREHQIEHLAMLAPPRMLGLLRTSPPGSLKGRLEELQGNLMRLKASELAEHPMVHDLLASTREPCM